MTSPDGMFTRVSGVIRYLAIAGLSRDQQPAVRHLEGRFTTLSFPGAKHVSEALKNRDYRETYHHLRKRRAYTVAMLDHALIQIMYRFRGSALASHRLAFFAAPNMEEFQNAPKWYLHDNHFVDVQARTSAPVLVRFDFDADEQRHRPVVHPKSHMTLGRYEGCRIPVSAPLSPEIFMDFILRNFYDTADKAYSNKLHRSSERLGQTIDVSEQRLTHIAIPI